MNAWKIHRLGNKDKISQEKRKFYIALGLIKAEQKVEKLSNHEEIEGGTHKFNEGRSSKNSWQDEVRNNKIGHIIIQQTERGRCREGETHTIFAFE